LGKPSLGLSPCSASASQQSYSPPKKQLDIFHASPLKTSSGLQLTCRIHAGFKRLAIERGSGMNLNDPWVTALESLDAGKC